MTPPDAMRCQWQALQGGTATAGRRRGGPGAGRGPGHGAWCIAPRCSGVRLPFTDFSCVP